MTGLGATLSTFPSFVVYFSLGGLLTALFVLLYAELTPHREITLIRDGNSAAAIALVGALLGFVVPLASVIAHSAALIDVVAWGVIALIVQLAVNTDGAPQALQHRPLDADRPAAWRGGPR